MEALQSWHASVQQPEQPPGRGATTSPIIFSPDPRKQRQASTASAQSSTKQMQKDLRKESAGVLARHSEAELLATAGWKRSLSPASSRGALSPEKRQHLRAHNARQVAGVVPFPTDTPISSEHGPRPVLLAEVTARLHAALASLGVPGHEAVTEINAALSDARADAVQAAFLDALEDLIQGFSAYRPVLSSIRHVLQTRLDSTLEAAAAVPTLVAHLADAEQAKTAALSEQAAHMEEALREYRLATQQASTEAAVARSRCDELESELAEANAAASAATAALHELRSNNSSLVAAYRRNEVAAAEAESKSHGTGKELSDVRAALRAVEAENRNMEGELERRRRDAAASVPITVHEKTKRSLQARSDELKELRTSNARLQADHVALVRDLRRRGAAGALKRVQSQWMDKLASALDVRMAGLGEGVNKETGALNLPGAGGGEKLKTAVHRVITEGGGIPEPEGGGEEGEGGLNFQLLVRMLTRIEQLKTAKSDGSRRNRRNMLSSFGAAGSSSGGFASEPDLTGGSGGGLGTIGEDDEDEEEERGEGGGHFGANTNFNALGSHGTVFLARRGPSIAPPPGAPPAPPRSGGGGSDPAPHEETTNLSRTTAGGYSIVREGVQGGSSGYATVVPHPALSMSPLPSGLIVQPPPIPGERRTGTDVPDGSSNSGGSPRAASRPGTADSAAEAAAAATAAWGDGVNLALLGPAGGCLLPPAQLPHYFNPLLPTPVVFSQPPCRPGAPFGSAAWANGALQPPAPVYRLAAPAELQHLPQFCTEDEAEASPSGKGSPRGIKFGAGTSTGASAAAGKKTIVPMGSSAAQPYTPPLSLVPYDSSPSHQAALAMPPHSVGLQLSHILNTGGDKMFNPTPLPVPFSAAVFRQRFFIGRGTERTVPRYLRAHGIIRNRFLSKRATERIVKQCWIAKEQAEAELRGGGSKKGGGSTASTTSSIVRRARAVASTDGHGQRVPLQGFFLTFLTQKYGSVGVAQEWAYSIVHALKRFVYDSDCEIFLRVLQGRLPEAVHHESLKLVTTLRDSLVAVDKSTNGGQATGVLPKHDIKLHVRSAYPSKAPSMMATLLAELAKDPNAQGEFVDYNELLSEDADGDQGEFVEMLRAQALREYQSYTADLTSAVAAAAAAESPGAPPGTAAAGGGGEKSQFIKVKHIAAAVRSVDPAKPKEEVAAILRRGWAGGRSLPTDQVLAAEVTISLAPFLIRMRDGWLQRSSSRL